MKRIMLIDGHALAYRAHYALIKQNMTDSSGMPTETMFGFFRMTAKLIKDHQPDLFAVVFDPGKKTFRHDIYKEYKANRQKTPEELKAQIDSIQQVLKKIQIPVLIPEQEEADDLLASVAHYLNTNHKNEYELLLVSGDKDLYNVLYPGVKLLRGRTGVSDFDIYDAERVQKKLSVTIEQIPDLMAMTGDSSDNVPGVKGIGEKTAAILLAEFGSLEKIYENIDRAGTASVQKKLSENRENAFLSLELVTLKKDLSFNFPKDFTFPENKAIIENLDILKEKELMVNYKEFMQLFSDGDSTAPASTPEESPVSVISDDNFQIIRNSEDLNSIIRTLSNISEFAIDTETTSVQAMEAQLVGISISWFEKDKTRNIYIPCVFDTAHEPGFDYQNLVEPETVLMKLKPLLQNAEIKKIGQNIKYDAMVLANHDITLRGIQDDTMILSYLLNPGGRRHSLDAIAEDFLLHETIKFKDIAGSGKKQKPLVNLPLEDLARYATEDSEVTLLIHKKLKPEVEKKDLYQLYLDIDRPLLETLMYLEQNGIGIDQKYLSDLQTEYEAKLETVSKQIYEDAGEEFNIASTKELRQILYEKLGIQSGRKTAKGALSTEASVLEELRDAHPVIDKLLQYRTLTKMLGTYIIPLPRTVNKATGRIHTSFSQITAATGRLASHDPNLQNIPVRGEEGRAMRRAFVPGKNHELLVLDYSQIELRILAHYCEDKNLVEAYKNDLDIHDQATYLLFADRFDAVNQTWLTQKNINEKKAVDLSQQGVIDFDILNKMKKTTEFSDFRSKAKILNFSIIYGVTDFGLSRNLGIERNEAATLIENYFNSYPGVRSYMDAVIEETRKTRMSVNLFGRKRPVPDINARNHFTRAAAERLAMNNPIQSTAADIIKLAMISLHKLLEKKKLKTKMLLQVHDELVFEVPVSEKKEILELATQEMQNATRLKVPLKVSGGFGPNWEEAK